MNIYIAQHFNMIFLNIQINEFKLLSRTGKINDNFKDIQFDNIYKEELALGYCRGLSNGI
jgi:hypothetical protein